MFIFFEKVLIFRVNILQMIHVAIENIERFSHNPHRYQKK